MPPMLLMLLMLWVAWVSHHHRTLHEDGYTMVTHESPSLRSPS